jgi:hypothetical protein
VRWSVNQLVCESSAISKSAYSPSVRSKMLSRLIILAPVDPFGSVRLAPPVRLDSNRRCISSPPPAPSWL